MFGCQSWGKGMNDEKHLCWYGDTEYFLKEGAVYRRAKSSDKAFIVYSETPIKRGYREFMNAFLIKAMEENDLFK